MPKHAIRPIPLNKGGLTYVLSPIVHYGSPQENVHYTWYIEGPTENILVDTGYDPLGLAAQSIICPFDEKFEHIQSLEEGLSKVGLKPEDIDIVIITHMHQDHINLARRYPKVKFIVQKAELSMARNPHPVQQFTYLMDPFNDLNFEVIEGDKKIVDEVSVMLTPGHTPGGQSVIVETEKGKCIITGFCCARRNFEPPPGLEMSVIPPGIVLDVIQTYDSMLRVKQEADIIIPVHDKEFLKVDRLPQ